MKIEFKEKSSEFVMTLTAAQFQTLFNLVDCVFAEGAPDLIEDKLLQVIFGRIYIKLYRQDIKMKNSYTVRLACEEAIAFYLWYANHQFSTSSHEGIIINIARDVINKRIA